MNAIVFPVYEFTLQQLSKNNLGVARSADTIITSEEELVKFNVDSLYLH